MLSVVTVNTDQDIVDPNDQLTSLREAIQMTNDLEGADEIVFDLGRDEPATIRLEHGELELTDEVTITGPSTKLAEDDASYASYSKGEITSVGRPADRMSRCGAKLGKLLFGFLSTFALLPRMLEFSTHDRPLSCAGGGMPGGLMITVG